jgi:hypothetical protein
VPLVRMRSRATAMAGLVHSRRWTKKKAIRYALPEGGVCLPPVQRHHIPLPPDLHLLSHRRTPLQPQWRGVRRQNLPPGKRGPSFHWLSSTMCDTVIRHHHSKQHRYPQTTNSGPAQCGRDWYTGRCLLSASPRRPAVPDEATGEPSIIEPLINSLASRTTVQTQESIIAVAQHGRPC